MPHLVGQGIMSNFYVLVFAFWLFPDDMKGAWVSKTMTSATVDLGYIYILSQTDWFEITRKAMMKLSPESTDPLAVTKKSYNTATTKFESTSK